ncbi:hypothetical protein VYU27_005405 [Nannochloropsis oceanica]
MMKEEALAKDTKLSKAFEHDKDPETVMLAAAGGKGSGVSNKPYRYIENYSLKDIKGNIESLNYLHKRSKLNMILYGNIVPAPGAPANTPSKLAVEVAVQTWSIYAHPQEQYQGLWLHSKYGEYRLMKPSTEYAPYADDFVRCVQYAVAIHLFVTDVVGVGDAEDDHMMDLEILMGMMTEQNLDMGFVRQNGSALFDLLRDLTMNKKLKFMVELSKMRAPVVAVVNSSSSLTSTKSTAPVHASSSGARKKVLHCSTAGDKPSQSQARSSRVSLAAKSEAMTSPGERSIDANAAAGVSGMDEGPAGEVNEEAKESKKRQKRKRRKAENSNTEEDALLTLPGCPFLHLSREVPKLINSLSGHNRRLLVAIEQQRTAEVIAKYLGEFERILDGLTKADFQPMHYLLSGIHSGESFFHAFFDLYRLLKRVRLTCPDQYKPRVAALRVRLVGEFTTPVLRDLWFIQNRGSVCMEVRALKDAEKLRWMQAKLRRLKLERAEVRKLKEAEKNLAKKERMLRRKERAIRREEWERGHEARKEARREEKAAGKAAARGAKRVAAAVAAAAAAVGEEDARMDIEVDGDFDVNPAMSRGEKRRMAEEGMEVGLSARRGGIISPASGRTDDSLLSSFLKGAEESKCTLSPMMYGGRRAPSANGGVQLAKTGLIARQQQQEEEQEEGQEE